MVDAIDAWVDVIFFAVATASSATAPAELKFSVGLFKGFLQPVLVLAFHAFQYEYDSGGPLTQSTPSTVDSGPI